MEASKAIDPVCKKEVDVLRARAVGIFGGVTYYFCSNDCKALYTDPRSAARATAQSAVIAEAAPKSKPATAPALATHIVDETPPSSGPQSGPPQPGRPAWAIPLAGGFLAVAAYLVWSAVHPARTPVAPTVTAVAPRIAVPVVVAVTDLAPASHDLGPQQVTLKAPLKVGLRRFPEYRDGRAVLSVRMLVIDAADDARTFLVAKLEGGPDDSATETPAEAVQPRAEFVASSAADGVLFDDTESLGAEKIAVRVSRSKHAIVADVKKADGEWQRSAAVAIDDGAQVRAAAFARKRYAETP